MLSKNTVNKKFSDKSAVYRSVKNSGLTNTIVLIIALLVAVAAAGVVFTVVKSKQDGSVDKTTTESSSFTENATETTEEETEETSTEKESSEPDKSDETAYNSSEMNKELAEQKFNEFLEIYNKWYNMSNVAGRYMKDSTPKVLDSGIDGYLITDKDIVSCKDVKSKLLAYCTDTVLKSIPTSCIYEESEGRLYIEVEPRSYCEYTFVIENIDKENDDSYIISTLCVAQEVGEPDLFNCKWTYERTEDGKWLLTEYKQNELSYDFAAKYQGYVKTEGSDLNIREYPSVNAEIVGRAKNGSSVSVYTATEEWAWIGYSYGDSVIEGWVKTDYLR